MDECDDDDDDSLRKHSSVTVSNIYALLTYDMSDSVRQLIWYTKVSTFFNAQNTLYLR